MSNSQDPPVSKPLHRRATKDDSPDRMRGPHFAPPVEGGDTVIAAPAESLARCQRFGRLLRTLGHLQASQLLYRTYYLLLRRCESHPRYRLDERLRNNVSRHIVVVSNNPMLFEIPSVPAGAERRRELQRGELTLLGQTHSFTGGEDWRLAGCAGVGRLWNHLLHCHAWLYELAGDKDPLSREFTGRLLNDWLDHCRPGVPGFANFAWNSYAIGTRLYYWQHLYHAMPGDFWRQRTELQAKFVQSFAMQAEYLRGHVEWDVRANHVLRNALGLAVAGRFLTGPLAERCLAAATRIALREVREQVLADGGHYERSPMYHSEALLDLLRLALLLRDRAVVAELHRTLARMVECAAWLRHPDGSTPQFNDGGRRDPAFELEAAARLGLQPERIADTATRHFADLGMFVWRSMPWTVFFDVGPIGPDHQPGHGHADTLSLEASFRGQRLFVDPGCYHYDHDQHRANDRGTAWHNTVLLDGENSSEVWHIFRVGRRARIIACNVERRDDTTAVTAAHDGYRYLPGAPVHRRRVAVDETLDITDYLEGHGNHTVQGSFLLEPGWQAQARYFGWILASGDTRLKLTLDGAAGHVVEPAVVHPDYGAEEKTVRLVWNWRGLLPHAVRVRCEPI